MSPAARASHFKVVQSFQTDYAPVTITQYVSERTGMQVVVTDQKGPKVHGYFTLATEIFDDSGSPHTLEHLIFMGSKSHRYKGLLDKLATRAYSFTNAWTATDHTAYTLDTAGWEGFAQILPVYLEHIILPTLTDEACLTEVHHVDGEGNDAGVVYSEMQGVQNNSAELMDLRARRMLYPENVGFRSETSGLLEQLRVLTPERIREFHKEMYQPKNLCVVIIGEVDHQNLLEVLDNFEESIKDDIPALNDPFRRPWIDSPQPKPLTKSIVEKVEFPEEDESSGDVVIGFLGPDCNDAVASAAMSVVCTFLAGSSVSVLINTLVEKEQLASTVTYWWDARPDTIIWFSPQDVETEKLEEVEKRFFEVLRDVVEKPLDMGYLTDCLKRDLRTLKFDSESSANSFSTSIINDFLFGSRDGSTLKDLATTQEFDVLASWTEQDWKSFMRKWICDAHHVSILGVPSKALAEKMKKEEVERLAQRKEQLGEEGLKNLAKRLEDAKAKNDLEIPSELLSQFPVPGVDSIHFIDTESARAGLARKSGVAENKAQKNIDTDGDIPLFLHFEHIPSNFVHISLLIETSGIPVEQLPLLTLYLENFFNTPITYKGERIEFEQVVIELEKDTIGYEIGGGKSLGDAEGLLINFQIEPEKYSKAIEWIKTMAFDSIFDVSRLETHVTKILAEIPASKRDGNSMALAVDSNLHLARESLNRARGILTRAVYMKRIKKMLKNDPETVISWLKNIQKAIFKLDHFRALVIADVTKLEHPVQAWKILADTLPPVDQTLPIVKQYQRLSALGEKPGTNGMVVIPMPTIDSSFFVSTTKGPVDLTDPRLPAIIVAVSYLDAVEGPLWRSVRGDGLAYDSRFSRDIDGGFLQFRIYRSIDAYKAFIAARTVLEDFISGKTAFESHALEGAVSSIVVGMADKQPNMTGAATVNFVTTVINNLDKDFNAKLLKKVREVTVDEIKDVMKNVLLPAFIPGSANAVVTCAPLMQEAMEKSFAEVGFKIQSKTLADFQDDYGLEQDEDNEDEDEDEDEDMEDDEDDYDSDEDDEMED